MPSAISKAPTIAAELRCRTVRAAAAGRRPAGRRPRSAISARSRRPTIEEGAKVNHLTYIGDARVGAGANIGAGTITCNYDGYSKFFTDIGEGAFIGSNSSLVAPVTIGKGAYVASGSVITERCAGRCAGLRPRPPEDHAGQGARNCASGALRPRRNEPAVGRNGCCKRRPAIVTVAKESVVDIRRNAM